MFSSLLAGPPGTPCSRAAAALRQLLAACPPNAVEALVDKLPISVVLEAPVDAIQWSVAHLVPPPLDSAQPGGQGSNLVALPGRSRTPACSCSAPRASLSGSDRYLTPRLTEAGNLAQGPLLPPALRSRRKPQVLAARLARDLLLVGRATAFCSTHRCTGRASPRQRPPGAHRPERRISWSRASWSPHCHGRPSRQLKRPPPDSSRRGCPSGLHLVAPVLPSFSTSWRRGRATRPVAGATRATVALPPPPTV